MWNLDFKQIEDLFLAISKFCAAVIFINLFIDFLRLVFFKHMRPGIALRRLWVSTRPSVEDIRTAAQKPVAADSLAKETRTAATEELYDKTAGSIKVETLPVREDAFSGQREHEKKRIGHILLESGLITKDVLEKALEHQKQYGGKITQYLLHYGYINEKQLAQCLSAQFKMPYLPVASYAIADEVIKLIPADIVEKYWVLPVDKHGKTLTVVMFDPLDSTVIKKLEDLTGLQIIPFVGIISEILTALQTYYKLFGKDGQQKIPSFFIEAKTYKGIERRAAIRYAVAVDVHFPADGQYLKSQTTDISRDGFAFTSTLPLNVGSYITLEINLPVEVSALPIAATTQVARCLVKQKNHFDIGVKTFKIAERDLGIIMDYAVTKKNGAQG